ncbi:MAG: cytochrome P450 [Caldilinea sp. CFX5]|nr:cytochrome P450 [Caldilinea sp. CFX5]
MTHNQTPPGPRTWPPLRLLFQMQRDPLTFFERLARNYGDIAYVQVGPRQIYMLNHPDFVQDVLVTHDRKFRKSQALQRARQVLGDGLLTSEGDYHLHQRRLIQPLFHRRQIATYAESMVNHTALLSDPAAPHHWQDGATLDIHSEMMKLTLVIVGETLFNQSLTDEASAVGAAMDVFSGGFRRLMSPIGPLLDRLPFPETRRLRQSRAVLDRIVANLIAERRKQRDGNDLLSLLLTAHEAGHDEQPMTDTQVRDEVLTLLLAGHETTANALTFAWWLLAQHPAAAAKLYTEVDQVLQGRLPTANDLETLCYTRMVFNEALRLYPPAWIIGRQALADHDIGGYTIPVGASIMLSPWVMHHDARYYPDPYRFDPERWTPAAQAARPKYSFFGFGAGSRVCIGEHFAWMEGTLILATLAQQWQVQPVMSEPLALRAAITLRPRDGAPLRVKRR